MYFLSQSRFLKRCHIDWVNTQLDILVGKKLISTDQRNRISWVEGKVQKSIPGFANNQDFIGDYGALSWGSTSQIPSFIVHTIDEGSYAIVKQAYTQQWTTEAQGTVKQVLLIEWAQMRKGLIEGMFEMYEYNKSTKRLTFTQRGKILPKSSENHEVIYIKQAVLLGDTAPSPEESYGFEVSKLAEDAHESIVADEELQCCPAGDCLYYCDHEPMDESYLRDFDPDGNNDTYYSNEVALRAAVGPLTNNSNSNNQINSHNNYDSHDVNYNTANHNVKFEHITIINYSPPVTPPEFMTFFHNIIQNLKLGAVLGDNSSPDLLKLAERSAKEIVPTCKELGLSPEQGTNDLATVSLYHSVILCDDSGSMNVKNRYEILKETVQRLAPIATKLSGGGVSLRFINFARDETFDDMRGKDALDRCLQNARPRGITPIGTVLKRKILEPFLLSKAREQKLDKPVLVTIITDGEPAGEDRQTLKNVVRTTKEALMSLKNSDGEIYGDRAVIFQINYVGDSADSKKYIDELEKDPDVGHLIFCNQEKIDDAWKRLDNSSSRNKWLLGLLTGAINQMRLSKE